MAEISASEISEYESIGFVVLRKRVDPVLVQKARDAVAERVQETRKTVREDRIFLPVCGQEDWPPECQALYEAIEKSVPLSQFCPPNSKLRMYSLIGVYQLNRVKGRGDPNAFFLTASLDEVLESKVNMPGYYEGSHISGTSAGRTKKSMKLEEGDILVWNGGTVVESEGGGGSFMLTKHSWG